MRLRLPFDLCLPQRDVIAGLTIALVAIPQSMAYAAIAGAAPIHGLYASIVPTIVGTLFGSSNFLVSGPTNATALVTANVLSTYAGQATYVEYVSVLAIEERAPHDDECLAPRLGALAVLSGRRKIA